MTSSATPLGKLMSYQAIYRDVSDGVFVSLRQTGYASIQIRRTAAARTSGLPLNYTRKVHGLRKFYSRTG